MIRIIKFLFTGDWHLHKWKDISGVDCISNLGGKWTRYYSQCEICGKHKKFD